MDDWTYGHLCAWADQYCFDDERDEVVAAIVALFDSGDEDDKARWLDHGWRHMRDLVAVSPATGREDER